MCLHSDSLLCSMTHECEEPVGVIWPVKCLKEEKVYSSSRGSPVSCPESDHVLIFCTGSQ